MSIEDPTECVAVLRSDLEGWTDLLRWTHGHFNALDLADNYRAGRPDMKRSLITRESAKAHDRIQAYLEEEKDELLSSE